MQELRSSVSVHVRRLAQLEVLSNEADKYFEISLPRTAFHKLTRHSCTDAASKSEHKNDTR